jgi:integrase
MRVYGYLVYTAVFSSGERFPVMLDRLTAQPVILPTRYVVDRRREFCQASTLEKDVRVLAWFYEWANGIQLDLEHRLRRGPPLTSTEIVSFARYIRLRRNAKLVGPIDPPYARERDNQAPPVLYPTVVNTYLAVIRAFVLWAIETHYANGIDDTADLDRAIRKIGTIFQSQVMNTPVHSPKYGLSTEDTEFLLGCANPASDCNPFNKPSRLRNYTIFRVLLETGIRRGELCKLRVKDLNTHGASPFIKVVRQPDDPNDPRRREPRVKTRERIIPITNSLCKRIIQYLALRPRYIKHPYLFVNTRTGAPLTLDGVTEIFLQVNSRFERFRNVELTPHTLRRTFNDRLLDSARRMGWEDQRVRDLQNYLNGWSEQSQQGAIYARTFIEQSALELAEAMQKTLYIDG